jgi:hypothetical protein
VKGAASAVAVETAPLPLIRPRRIGSELAAHRTRASTRRALGRDGRACALPRKRSSARVTSGDRIRVEARAGDSRAEVENSVAHAAPALTESKRPDWSAPHSLLALAFAQKEASGPTGATRPQGIRLRLKLSCGKRHRAGDRVLAGPSELLLALSSGSSACRDPAYRRLDYANSEPAGGSDRRRRPVAGAVIDSSARGTLVRLVR